jgi:hypothetical protein
MTCEKASIRLFLARVDRKNLEFSNPDWPGLTKLDAGHSHIRTAMIAYMKVPYIESIPPDIPSVSEWDRLDLAWPVGQIEDRVYPLPDGRRLHYQRFPGNIERIHIDSFDPDNGYTNKVLHVAMETPIGVVATAMLVIAAIALRMRK